MTSLPLLTDPRDVLARYEAALANDQLMQGDWHVIHDGRWLACALGVIGDEVSDAKDCPASIMPRWLAQMVPEFFDCQKADDAKAWGLRFYKALSDVGGKVPFAAIHHWHAHTVCPLGIDAAKKLGRDVDPHKALQALHIRALGGEKISADEWRPVLKNAYASADACAYAYVRAYAYANADAANVHMDAYAKAYAKAYAVAGAYAYADTYAAASADAWSRLADGMVDAINATGGAA